MYVPDIYNLSFFAMPLSDLGSSSRRSINCRRAKEIACTGSLAPFSCESCLSLNRLCILAPGISKCCSSCLALHKGCSLVSELSYLNFLSKVESLRSQEIALQDEFSFLSQKLKICLEQLDSLRHRRASLSSVPH
jgi:hypothetical protein